MPRSDDPIRRGPNPRPRPAPVRARPGDPGLPAPGRIGCGPAIPGPIASLAAYHLREVAAEFAILASNHPAGMVPRRITGDALDTTLIPALRRTNAQRRGAAARGVVLAMTEPDRAVAPQGGD